MTMMDASQIDKTALSEPVEAVERFMAAFIMKRPLPGNLRDAIEYSLLGGGKRLRPILCVRACQAVGGKTEQSLPPAAAIEMIHAFSLVHDDLPAMDDDDLRRGQPTLHKATNEAMAILAGDAMMGLAFEIVLSEVRPADLAAKIVHELAEATNNMIAGQVYDTLPDFPADIEPLEKLKIIHRNKTGALIRCACRMGAIAGGANSDQLQSLTRFGEDIGLMFQVMDDLLDVTQSTEHLGKTAGKDVEQDKATYPALLGLDETRTTVTRLRDDAFLALEPLGKAAQPLRDLTAYMAMRTN